MKTFGTVSRDGTVAIPEMIAEHVLAPVPFSFSKWGIAVFNYLLGTDLHRFWFCGNRSDF